MLHKPISRSPYGGLCAVSHAKLANDVLHVLFDGLVADVQGLSNLFVMAHRNKSATNAVDLQGNRSRVGVRSFEIAVDTEHGFHAQCSDVKARGFHPHPHSARD